MHTNLLPKKGLLWAAASALALSAWSVKAQDEEVEDEDEDEEDVEEMVVTGSYIRRSNFDLPSPRDVVDSVDLSLSATSDLGEVVFDQTFQIGVNANSAPIEFNSADDQEFQQGSETWANLRGLGTRATMTMMDGHRVPANVTGYGSRTRRAGTDLSNLYPGIATGRIETILDGASALYGASAVSGVINVVPRKDFDGLQVDYEYRQPLEDGSPEKRLGLLAGAQGERTQVIFALEVRDQTRMRGTERPDYIISSANWTGQLVHPYQERPWSHPGDWNVPIRDSDGVSFPGAERRLGLVPARHGPRRLGQHPRLDGRSLLAQPRGGLVDVSSRRPGWWLVLTGTYRRWRDPHALPRGARRRWPRNQLGQRWPNLDCPPPRSGLRLSFRRRQRPHAVPAPGSFGRSAAADSATGHAAGGLRERLSGTTRC